MALRPGSSEKPGEVDWGALNWGEQEARLPALTEVGLQRGGHLTSPRGRAVPSAGWGGVAMWVGGYVPNLWVTSPDSLPSGMALCLGWGCVCRSSSLDQAWAHRGCFSNPSRNLPHESMIRAVLGSLRPAPGQLEGGGASLICRVSRSGPGSGPTVGGRERGGVWMWEAQANRALAPLGPPPSSW